MTCRRDGLVALSDIAAGGGPSAPGAPGARERDGRGMLGRHRDGGWRLPKVLINAQGAQGFMARIGMKSLSTLSTLGDWRLPEWDVIQAEIGVHVIRDRIMKMLTGAEDAQVFMARMTHNFVNIFAFLSIFRRTLTGQGPQPTAFAEAADLLRLDADLSLCPAKRRVRDACLVSAFIDILG